MFELKILALCVSKVGSVLSKMEQMGWFRHGVLCTGWATSPVFIQTGFFYKCCSVLGIISGTVDSFQQVFTGERS